MRESDDVYMRGIRCGPLCHAFNRMYVRWIRVRDDMQEWQVVVVVKRIYCAREDEDAESFDDFQNFSLLRRLGFFLASRVTGSR